MSKISTATRPILWVWAALLASASSDALGSDDRRITFTRDVAPILFEACASCHRPGESGPFPLLTYDEARRRARQIAEVTLTRYMPPWKPDGELDRFAGDRRLTDREVGAIQQWVAEGAAEGDPADLPPRPTFVSGWQLGEPDLVIELADSYELDADGRDVFRNFVIPAPLTSARYVRAVELRPGNPRVVHHGLVKLDRTRLSRKRDEEDPGVGFGSMDMGMAQSPDGHHLVWVPGKRPWEAPAGMAWRLEPGDDLVVQLHMRPSGKAETIRPSLGLFFADAPPSAQPTVFQLGSAEIDIPAGEAAYVVEDRFRLPVGVEVLGLFPHAHYLGKSLEARATLPDGTELPLIRIRDWDFDWQDEYRFTEPLHLPRGTRIAMRYVYDNSVANVRNPNNPPRRVVAGDESTDEMATLTLQVLTDSTPDRMALMEAISRRRIDRNINAPWVAHYNLGITLQSRGEIDRAIEEFRKSLAIRPDFLQAHGSLGIALRDRGQLEQAEEELRTALAINPDSAETRFHLGTVLERRGELPLAVEQYRRAVALRPDFVEAHGSLGVTLALLGRLDEAMQQYRRVLELDPESADAHYQLGLALHAQGQVDLAMTHYREAIRLAPDLIAARGNLGIALAGEGDPEGALEQYRAALAIEPDSVQARFRIGALLLDLGRNEEGIRELERALTLAPGSAEIHRQLARGFSAQGDDAAARRHRAEADRLATSGRPPR